MMKKCPVCKKPIKLENLEKHLKKVHPKEKIDFKYTKKEKKMLEDRKEKVKELEKPVGMGKIVAVAIVIIIALLAVTIFYPQAPSGYGPLPVGSKVKDFTVMDTNGQQITLSAWVGQVIYLDFMQTTCGHCQLNTIETLVPISTTYPEVKILSIAINADATIQDLKDWKDNTGATWSYALDTVGANDMYGVDATPFGFLIDQSGTVVSHHRGRIDFDTVSAEIAALL